MKKLFTILLSVLTINTFAEIKTGNAKFDTFINSPMNKKEKTIKGGLNNKFDKVKILTGKHEIYLFMFTEEEGLYTIYLHSLETGDITHFFVYENGYNFDGLIYADDSETGESVLDEEYIMLPVSEWREFN